ncbi:hypothetical protein M378DRAFT_90412 [Amanita muscaria Koide BX008]|uniref:NACHT domain-containing protein n=1 Tax=Amanita muscaria (strain Koide BX008) TaxID=946122 RepID=A0A0C2W3Q4_AMAMK|nr:hypothetical protein M378DRAFT_90412 [Amanita muscaria Koide BX008]
MSRCISTDVLRLKFFARNVGDNQHINLVAYAKAAGLNTTKACLEGTREEILHDVVDWMDNPDINAARILWLFGAAGTGKSAIAHTIARCMKDAGALASCFCFEKGDVKRYTKLFTTISRDLAGRDLRFKQALASIVARDPSITTTVDIVQQWERLVMEPISVISGSIVGRLVIVIDALDESGDDQSRKHILDTLTKKAAALPSNIRILLTSHPIHDICKAFEAADHVMRVSMDDIPMSSTKRDIHSYISDQLSDTDHHFSVGEIARIVERSDGLFEWVRLACNYIKSSNAGLSEKERFDDLMSRTEREGVELLDNMYNVILKEILGERPQERVLARFRSVMRHVLFTMEPLALDPLITLHRSIQNEHNRYDAEATILRPMASVLASVHNRSTPIRPLHSSFHDFLTDQDRSGQFFVDEADAHHDLTLSTLNIMQRELRFNICRLESSYLRNSEVSDMAQRVKLYISPQLSYSCLFLVNHVAGTPFNSRVADALRAILGNEWTMYWIETLSALQSVSIVLKSLTLISEWLEVRESYELAVAAAKDGIQLIQNFGTIISESIPHLYLSTLPFLPQNSVFSGSFSSKFPLTAKLVSGKTATWPPAQCLLGGHDDVVKSVAFSPDGKLAVSGSKDKTIRIWNTEIGVLERGPLYGHSGGVNSVAFSPDGKQIVSGSGDRSVCIWDAATGSLVRGPLQGHSGVVWAVVFSPDGTKVVSGSSDQTICMWDVESGLMINQPLKGHSDSVWALSFSPDGQRFISGSGDKTICMWDAYTGLKVCKPFEGHSGAIYSITFSCDGRKIVSGSEDKTICIWDAKTGVQLHSPLTGHSHSKIVSAVAFSSDGERIISGSADNTICVWGAKSSLQLGSNLKGHTDWVRSVAFSPDNGRIVSGSFDHTIRCWNATTGQQVGFPLRGHIGLVSSTIFSPDGKFILSSSTDVTMRVWEAELDNLQSLEHLNSDGWIIGPEGRLLLWVPVPFRKLLHTPATVLVLPQQAVELDLSMMAHGNKWTNCFTNHRAAVA